MGSLDVRKVVSNTSGIWTYFDDEEGTAIELPTCNERAMRKNLVRIFHKAMEAMLKFPMLQNKVTANYHQVVHKTDPDWADPYTPSKKGPKKPAASSSMPMIMQGKLFLVDVENARSRQALTGLDDREERIDTCLTSENALGIWSDDLVDNSVRITASSTTTAEDYKSRDILLTKLRARMKLHGLADDLQLGYFGGLAEIESIVLITAQKDLREALDTLRHRERREGCAKDR